MNKLKHLTEKLFSYPFVRFIFVGSISTGINYAVYLTCIFFNFQPNWAYLSAFGISIICNYFLSSYFTFQVKPQVQRAIKFLGAHLINLVNEMILLNICLYYGIDKFIAPLVVFMIAFPLNFFIVRYALKGNVLVSLKNYFRLS